MVIYLNGEIIDYTKSKRSVNSFLKNKDYVIVHGSNSTNKFYYCKSQSRIKSNVIYCEVEDINFLDKQVIQSAINSIEIK